MVTWGIAILLIWNQRFRPRDRYAGRVEARSVPGWASCLRGRTRGAPGTDGGSRCGFTGDVRCGRAPAHAGGRNPVDYSPLGASAAIAGSDAARSTSRPSCRRARKWPPTAIGAGGQGPAAFMACEDIAGQPGHQQRRLAVGRYELQIVQAAMQRTGIAESQHGLRPMCLDAGLQPGMQRWRRWAAEQRQRVAGQSRQGRRQYDPIGLFTHGCWRTAWQQPDALGAARGRSSRAGLTRIRSLGCSRSASSCCSQASTCTWPCQRPGPGLRSHSGAAPSAGSCRVVGNSPAPPRAAPAAVQAGSAARASVDEGHGGHCAVVCRRWCEVADLGRHLGSSLRWCGAAQRERRHRRCRIRPRSAGSAACCCAVRRGRRAGDQHRPDQKCANHLPTVLKDLAARYRLDAPQL